MKLRATIALIATLIAAFPAASSDLNQPEGWATCSSVTSGDDYALTGGGDGSLIVLRSDGTNMFNVIRDAVNTHDVIVFDGKDGEFILQEQINFYSLSGRTLIGVNGARFRTAFSVTQEIRDLLDGLDINSYSSNPNDHLGGTLSNGQTVNEQCELMLRQALIDHFNDQTEPYRQAGIFNFINCSNIIIRNIDFQGPGSLDVGGDDLLTLHTCDHVWVDHCRFTDGLDGNLDIVQNSDFVTVSDCHFRYTNLSYNHPLSNLNSGYEVTDGSPQKNNISWFRCFWDEGCKGRMPYIVHGIHHILNCYWYCTNGTCIDAHDGSRILIDRSYFTNKVKSALVVRKDNVQYEWRKSLWKGKTAPVSNATIDVPYTYSVWDVNDVPAKIKSAGPTLADPYSRPLSSSPSVLDFGKVYSNNQIDNHFNLSAFGSDAPSSMTITAPAGILLSTSADGEFVSSLTINATDENLIQADIYIKAVFNTSGAFETAIEVTADGHTLIIPVKADVMSLGSEAGATTLHWPLDKGGSSPREASTEKPEMFSSAAFRMGEKIYIHSPQPIGGQIFTLFNPTEAVGKIVDEECCIAFDVVTAPGYVFVPKKLTFNAARVGTDMCFIDIDCSRDEGPAQKLVTGFHPERSSNPSYFSKVDVPLTTAGTGESLRIKIYLYNMLANKQLALSDVKIEGDTYVANSAIDIIPADATEGQNEYYDLMGRRVDHPCPGNLYILRPASSPARIILYR